MSIEELAPGRSIFHLRLLYEDPVVVGEPGLQAALSERLPGALVSPRDARGTIAIRGPGALKLAEGQVPAALAITSSPIAPYAVDDYRQSWRWGTSAAADVGNRARYALALGELTSMMLATEDRVHALLETTASLVESHPPLAIHWCRLQRFDDPGTFLRALEGPDRAREVLNVRVFRVSEDGAFVMDTLGLCLLGMLDLQVHFRGLDLGEVAEYLYTVAMAHVGLGPEANVHVACPIEDGDTIDGPDGSASTCRYEMAMMAPRRGVIDIEPSQAFSAR